MFVMPKHGSTRLVYPEPEFTNQTLETSWSCPETTAPIHSAHSVPGRATGKFPRARRGRARRWSMCGRRRRRRVRTRSCPEPRGYRWGRRCRSWPQNRLRQPSRISCRACCSCSRCCRSAAAPR